MGNAMGGDGLGLRGSLPLATGLSVDCGSISELVVLFVSEIKFSLEEFELIVILV